MWTRYFIAFSGEQIVHNKTLAHASAADVEAGRTTWWEKNANNLADQYAKLGAKVHPLSENDFLAFKAYALVANEAAR